MRITTVELDIPYAFHSAQMDAICEPYNQICETITLEKSRIQVVSSLLGSIVTEKGKFNAAIFALIRDNQCGFQRL